MGRFDFPTLLSSHHRDSILPDRREAFHHIYEVLYPLFDTSLLRKSPHRGRDDRQWVDLLPSHGPSWDKWLWADRGPRFCDQWESLLKKTGHDSILAESGCGDSEDLHPESKTLWAKHSAVWKQRHHENGLPPKTGLTIHREFLLWWASIESPLRGEYGYSSDQTLVQEKRCSTDTKRNFFEKHDRLHDKEDKQTPLPPLDEPHARFPSRYNDGKTDRCD